jgi:hypothetical protein
MSLDKRGSSYRPTVDFPDGDRRKFVATDKTSPWWYDDKSLTNLVFQHIAVASKGGKDITLREFVFQFRGLTSTQKTKVVCDQFPGIERLSDFETDPGKVAELLEAMKAEARAPSENVLGCLGEAHLRTRFNQWFGVERFWYHKGQGSIDGLPFVFEAAVAVTRRPGRLFHGVDFSPTFGDPLAETHLYGKEFSAWGPSNFLEQGHVHPERPNAPQETAVAIHLICPALEFLDRGKSRLTVPEAMRQKIQEVLWKVVKDLYREEERRRKDAARQERADRDRAQAGKAKRMDLTKALRLVMKDAVQEATGGIYEVSAHTLYYVVRRLIQKFTTKALSSDYFEGNLLPAYQREHGAIAGLYYEARGTLYEPHTRKAIPLGTREVESYQFPAWLYDKILFVEKQGLWPVLEKSRLAERFDMAVVASEGYATEACRVLFANAEKGKDYQLFVVHDADPHGYNIARTLREETARMPGHRVRVVDIGLKLADALEMGLGVEDFTRRKALPQGLELTDQERTYFEGRRSAPKSWIARRVELNALSAPDLLAYIERKLQAADIRSKVIPSEEALPWLTEELYGDIMREQIEDALDRLLRTNQLKADITAELRGQFSFEEARRWITDAFQEDGTVSWRGALWTEIEAIVHTKVTIIRQVLRGRAFRAING